MRFSELAPEHMTQEQALAHAAFLQGSGGNVGPAAHVLIRSPGLSGRMLHVGDHAHSQTSLTPACQALAILACARAWRSRWLWEQHLPRAVQAGMDEAGLQQMVKGGPARALISELAPACAPDLAAKLAAVLDFCTQLHGYHQVSDECYANTIELLGEAGLVDLIGLSGYYTFIAMCLNTNEGASLPAGSPPGAGGAPGMENRPPMRDLSPEEMSEQQLSFYRELTPNGKSFSVPMRVLIRVPELARRAQAVSEYLRFHATLSRQMAEFCICITAVHWNTATMWKSHSAELLKLGLTAETLEDLKNCRRPAAVTPDLLAAWDFCTQLHQEKQVSDAVFEAAQTQLGASMLAELIGVCGYYSLSAMVLNVGRKLPA